MTLVKYLFWHYCFFFKRNLFQIETHTHTRCASSLSNVTFYPPDGGSTRLNALITNATMVETILCIWSLFYKKPFLPAASGSAAGRAEIKKEREKNHLTHKRKCETEMCD